MSVSLAILESADGQKWEDAKKKAQDYIDRATQRAESQRTEEGTGSREGGRNVCKVAQIKKVATSFTQNDIF